MSQIWTLVLQTKCKGFNGITACIRAWHVRDSKALPLVPQWHVRDSMVLPLVSQSDMWEIQWSFLLYYRVTCERFNGITACTTVTCERFNGLTSCITAWHVRDSMVLPLVSPSDKWEIQWSYLLYHRVTCDRFNGLTSCITEWQVRFNGLTSCITGWHGWSCPFVTVGSVSLKHKKNIS